MPWIYSGPEDQVTSLCMGLDLWKLNSSFDHSAILCTW